MLTYYRLSILPLYPCLYINLFDWGTHWFDMMFFFNDETPAEWVLGQISVEEEIFGVPVETSGISWIRFANGVDGLLATGGWEQPPLTDGVPASQRGVDETPVARRVRGL